MIRARIALSVALLVAALPAQAMFGFGPVQTYYHWGDAYDPAESGQTQVVLVRDVDNDGLDDVLLAHDDYVSPTYGLYLLVFLQDPATHALREPVKHLIVAAQDFAYSIDAADLDGDGIPEIVVGSDHGATVLSPAQGFAVTAFIDHWSLLNTARFGDFDGDGAPDLLLLVARDMSPTGNDVWLYRGDGAGHFEAGRKALFPEQLCCLTDMRAVDFNGDGSLDIAMHMAPLPWIGSYYGLTGIWGYANNGDGTFRTTNVVYPDVWRQYQSMGGLAAGDLDGDGRPDLAGGVRANAYSAINGIRAYFHGRVGKPYIGFRAAQGGAGEYTTAVRIRDMDGDGRMDVVFAENTYTNEDPEGNPVCYIEYVPSAGKNVYRTRHSCSMGPDSMDVGDINGDGLQDVVVADPDWGFGWTLGTDAEPIVNLVVGEGLSPGTAAFTLKNASTSATIAGPSVEITYSVNRGKIELADWPQQCSRPDPQVLRIVCSYPDLAVAQSATGVVHYSVLQSQPYMQLHAKATATTSTEETVTSDNAAVAASWIRQL